MKFMEMIIRERERVGINVLHESDNILYYKHEFQSPLLLSLFFFLRILSILTHTHTSIHGRGEQTPSKT